MNETVEKEKPTTEGTARIVYILYLVGIILFITDIIGLVIAYIYRGDAPRWLRSHYQFQIRTFWIGALYALIGVIFIFDVIGFWTFLLLWAVWMIIRCVKGIKSLDQKEIHPNPTGWMF